MDGFLAGIISVAAALVGVALITTLVKNGDGTASLINSVTGGFAKDLSAAQGNNTGY